MASAATNLSLDVIRGRLLPGPNLLINVHNLLKNYLNVMILMDIIL